MLERKYFHDLFGGEASLGSISPRVILVNNPLSVPLLSRELEAVTPVADHYEFRLMTGSWNGIPISICSTGIGGGSASIAMDNLVRLGAETLIYIDAGPTETGTHGVWAATGAVRQDGASLDYARAEFPAVTDVEVLLAVQAAAQQLKVPMEMALFWSSAGPLSPENRRVIQSYSDREKSSITPYPMSMLSTPGEPATILTLATLYHLRAGAIYGGVEIPSQLDPTLHQLFLLALSSLGFLRLWDTRKDQNGWKLMTPSSKLSEA